MKNPIIIGILIILAVILIYFSIHMPKYQSVHKVEPNDNQTQTEIPRPQWDIPPGGAKG